MTRTRIEGGQVIDLATGALQPRTLVVDDGVLAALAMPGSLDANPADQVVDVAGAILAPGFIDLHAHVFAHDLFRTGRIPADRIGVDQGVACVVDAGSFGAALADGFARTVIATQATAVRAFINIGSPGLPGLEQGHAARPELCDLEGTVRAFERHPDWLVGVKVLASQSHTGSFGLEAIRMARKAAELVDRPLMVHLGNAPPVIDDILDLMRPGDIVTHAYHGKVGGVLGYRDRVIAPFRAAVERGVVVDLGHGQASFSFRTCETALAQGMPLHTVSTDLHRGSLDRHAVSLARTLTKVRLLGVPLHDAIRAVTINPARAIRIDAQGFGGLQPGLPARITAFREVDEPTRVTDANGETRTAPTRIETTGVLLGERWFPVVAPL